MESLKSVMRLIAVATITAAALGLICADAIAGGKLGVYILNMSPNGADAEDYSDNSWGGALHVVAPIPAVHSFLAGTGGIEVSNFMRETVEFRDRVTGLRVEQQTSQDYVRAYVGGRAGGHGNGFVRPFAGLNVAVVHYSISTDVVVPDDSDRENEIRQNLRSKGKTVFGYDLSLGADLNFSNKIAVEGGVRYMKSFGLTQQLGEDAKKVSPEYFQVYLGIAASFDLLKKQ